MGLVAIISEFFRSGGLPTIKGTAEEGTTISAIHCAAPGDDSPPLPTDYAGVVDSGGTGTHMTVGYVDTGNQGIAEPGEKRLYARGTDGAIVNELYMHGDGSVTITNAQMTIVVGTNTVDVSGGTVFINGVSIDSNGNITTNGTIKGATIEGTNSVKAAGKELANHTHNVVSGAGAPGATGPNL